MGTKMHLSKTQIDVLRELEKGAILHYIGGLSPRWFLSASMKTVKHPTVWILDGFGLIKITDEYDQRGLITDKGKEYLRSIPIGAKAHEIYNL